MTAPLIICDARDDVGDQKPHDGRAGGDRFAAAVEAAAHDEPSASVRRFSCLMKSKGPCSATLYDRSDNGVAPSRRRPAGAKGRFVSRAPSAAMIDAPEAG